MRRFIPMLACLLFALMLSMPAVAEEYREPKPDEPSARPSLEERVAELERAAGQKTKDHKWYDRIRFSGLLEVEASNYTIDYDDEAVPDEKGSDIDLASAELAVDAKIAAHVEGHVRLKWEPEGDEPVFLDEGFIALFGTERYPAYLIAGRQYVPFGNFESHFVTDPTTLLLAETNEGAVVAGYRLFGDRIDMSVGAFNGKAKKTGDHDDINGFVASITAQPLEGLNVGASYASNLAGSTELNEQVVDPDNLDRLVGGWSAFVIFSFLDRFKVIGEYVGALDRFRAGELYDPADTRERKPAAWNTELGVALIDNLELALRYGGADDGGSGFLPETQYGAVMNWFFFENTNLAVEYLHNEFEGDVQKVDVVTVQLALVF